MRFTFVGIPRSRRGRRSASASLSFTPASSTYSKVMRRPCASGNLRAASSSTAMGQRRFTGMIRSRTSSVVAFSEMARFGAGERAPSFSIPGTMPTVETVIRRGETVLAEVKSSWCCLDAATLRPSRIASDVAQIFLK